MIGERRDCRSQRFGRRVDAPLAATEREASVLVEPEREPFGHEELFERAR